MKRSAAEIKVTGIVQGVGFRPHVYRLANKLGLAGWIINTTNGVTIRVEGRAKDIKGFVRELQTSPPPLAYIESLRTKKIQPEGYSAFFIQKSSQSLDADISIPPDVGTCPDCLKEYNDPNNRRYGYPFTNCVNCGPRFSIIRASPYDRKNTSMNVFRMCADCAGEYEDPANRRFHAEPNACPTCGPQLLLTLPDGRAYNGDIRALLKAGKILAVKGIGAYHLACDAKNDKAVRLLRKRKKRQTKPFALMCRDLDVVRKNCELSLKEEELLTSPARPILLLKKRQTSMLCDEIAPGLDTLGVMLPYTPLHYGLFDDDISILVMTSANISGDPLIITEREAYSKLGFLADFFVVNKREIVNRADDSVVMSFMDMPYFIRRARGYVPQGIHLPCKVDPIFAAGGDLKGTFAYASDKKAVISQYFGDLGNLENFEAFKEGVRFFGEFLQIKPQSVACDIHPGYISTRFASAYAKELSVPLIKVQHHKAHFASAMADNALNESVLGVICDGTGYGEDGTIWGCEVFHGNYQEIKRVGSLESFLQPRGDEIIKYPLQMASVLLYSLWKDEDKVMRVLPGCKRLLPFVKAQVGSKTLCIESSSCGRLFDAAAAICGFTAMVSYEGEAAMRLESLAHYSPEVEPYSYSIHEGSIMRLSWGFLSEMADDKLQGTEASILAARFHTTFINALAEMVSKLAVKYKTDKVVFSGGTFQNRFVIKRLAERLKAMDIMPYFHRQVPTNDSGLALGQLMIAANR
ncbi:MAG: carbamoyltransferase HypF [Actinomycetota bacterium]|nr:carbamoyltransferase HypF [Actinomycetota bacterium]